MTGVAEAVVLGFASGPVCVASCGPVLLPWLAAEPRGLRATGQLLGVFLGGRLAGYLAFAVIAWTAGVALPVDAGTRTLIFGLANLGVGVLLLVSAAFPRRHCAAQPASADAPVEANAAKGEPLVQIGPANRFRPPAGLARIFHQLSAAARDRAASTALRWAQGAPPVLDVPSSTPAGGSLRAPCSCNPLIAPRYDRGATSGLTLGFLTGLNLCPPFVAAGVRAAEERSLAGAGLFFVLFFAGTTVWFLPSLAVSPLRRFEAVPFVARITMAVLALYYAYLGVVSVSGWSLSRSLNHG